MVCRIVTSWSAKSFRILTVVGLMVIPVESADLSNESSPNFNDLVSEIEAHVLTAKKASVDMQGTMIDVSERKTNLSEAIRAFEKCTSAAQTALRILNGKLQQEIIPDESPNSNDIELNSDPTEKVEIDELTGVYPSEDELNHTSKANEATPLPAEIQVDTLNHLMFVIHGIGEHTDFQEGAWDKTPELVGENPVFRNLFRTTRDAFLSKEIPLALEIQSIEWHAELHATGVDPVFDMIAPEGSDKIRQFNKRAFMDLLYYTAPKFSQLIVNSVTSQLNSKYKKFMEQHPGWMGQVSIFSHSLGTIIAYDILTHEAGDVSAIGVKYDGLDFAVENFFCAGSPVPVMVLSRGDINLAVDGVFTEGIKVPNAKHYFNFFHPLDPIAYRIEPLIHANTADLPPVQLLPADFIKTKSFGELVQLYDAVAGPTRQDFVLRQLPHEGILNLAFAPFSHSSYWTSQDVVLFTLLQICRPVADKIREYVKAGLPLPIITPNSFKLFTPHKRPRLATTASVRNSSSGGWYPQPIFLGHGSHLYYVNSIKDVACCKKLSISFGPNTHVEASESDSLAFRLVPDKKSTLYSVLPVNSSSNATQLIKATTTEQRDEWVGAIQQVLGIFQSHGAILPRTVRSDGLILTSGGSIDYFGALKTGLLGHAWGTKWFVLTNTSLDIYDAIPQADKWIQFSFETVFASLKRYIFRFIQPLGGAALSLKVQDESIFQLWLTTLQETPKCTIILED